MIQKAGRFEAGLRGRNVHRPYSQDTVASGSSQYIINSFGTGHKPSVWPRKIDKSTFFREKGVFFIIFGLTKTVLLIILSVVPKNLGLGQGCVTTVVSKNKLTYSLKKTGDQFNMRKILALSSLLALGALGMACGDAAPANNTANKAANTAANTMANAANAMANAANTAANTMANAANTMANAANSMANAANAAKPTNTANANTDKK